MTALRGFVITISSGISFSLCGAGLGYAIGKYAPDYYRIVFGIPPEIQFDPVEAGVGLGITQGLTAGLLAGLVIVISVSWYNSRLTRPTT